MKQGGSTDQIKISTDYMYLAISWLTDTLNAQDSHQFGSTVYLAPTLWVTFLARGCRENDFVQC